MTPRAVFDTRKELRHTVHDLLTGLLLLGLFLAADARLQISQGASVKIGDLLACASQGLTLMPRHAEDILLVGIDSQTAARMKERWPYSRKTFATVIDKLQRAGAKAIALDFSFFGGSANPEEDRMLREALSKNDVVLGAGFGEKGGVVWSSIPELKVVPRSGIVNKLQDSDGAIRHALTYLVSTNPSMPDTKVFSWELKLLEASRQVNLASMEDQGGTLAFKAAGRDLYIPVDPRTKTFTIRFRAHTDDFARLSFHQVHEGQFDPAMVKGKIVMIGFLSLLFQDLHQTPIGWLPGLTLNANAFLTLHGRDFLRPLPFAVELIFLIVGLCAGVLLVHFLRPAESLCWLGVAVAAFFILSCGLYVLGWTWNYARFPAVVPLVPWMLQWSDTRRQVALQRRVSALFSHSR